MSAARLLDDIESKTDVCPKCSAVVCDDTPTAGRCAGGWRCTRCGLDATSLANAKRYRTVRSTDVAQLYDLACHLADDGVKVDAESFARTMGRYYGFSPDLRPRADERLRLLLAEALWQHSDPFARSPMRASSDGASADLLLVAMHAAGYAVVDMAGGMR